MPAGLKTNTADRMEERKARRAAELDAAVLALVEQRRYPMTVKNASQLDAAERARYGFEVEWQPRPPTTRRRKGGR